MIATILIAIISTIVMIGVFIVKNKDNSQNVEAYYDFKDGELKTSSTNYIDNDDFRISDFTEFQNFATSVNNGCSFSDKTVKLVADIDCDGEDIQIGKNYIEERRVTESGAGHTFYDTKRIWFSGDFNGNGHTISNINYTSKNGLDHNTEDCNSEGLFLNNSGTIENLKLSNFYMFISSNGNDTRAGIICGYNKGTIKNCIVEDIKFISDRYQSNCTLGSLAGMNEGTVQNCLVQGYYKIGGYSDNFLSNDDGLVAAYFVGQGPNEAVYSVFKASVEEIEKTSCVKSPSEHDSALDNGKNNYSTASSASVGLTSNAQCSTSGGNLSYPWYYCSEYNDGWPYLRRFITWKTIDVRSDITGITSVSTSSIKLPEDLKVNNGQSGVVSSSATFSFYGQTVSASFNECYSFSQWYYSVPDIDITISGYLIPELEKNSVTIKFVSATNTSVSTTNLNLDTAYTIGCGNSITICYSAYEKEGYRSITLSFTDSEDTERSITYTASNGYYITTSTLQTPQSTTDYFYVHSHGTMPDLSAISVTTARKSYNASFS